MPSVGLPYFFASASAMIAWSLSLASLIAQPPTYVPREAMQAPVVGQLEVSTSAMQMRSNDTPTPSAAICAWQVRRP